jgi:hypothetical protein
MAALQSDDGTHASKHAVSLHAHFETHVKFDEHLPPETSPDLYLGPNRSAACASQCCWVHDVQAGIAMTGEVLPGQADIVLLEFDELLLQATTAEMAAAASSEKPFDPVISDPPGVRGIPPRPRHASRHRLRRRKQP